MARTPDGNYVRIENHDKSNVQGIIFASSWKNFAELLKDADQVGAHQKMSEVGQEGFVLPFEHLHIKTLGLGLTYPDHQEDVGVSKIVMFEKNAAPSRLVDTVAHRESLDYEAEIALLLHRHEPNIFGYLLHNDLTDRMIQATTYQEENPGSGFSKAKSFATANAYGTLMAVGTAQVWQTLRMDFYWNNVRAQSLHANQNLLTPSEIHKKVFESSLSQDSDWILIGTGTPGGTIL